MKINRKFGLFLMALLGAVIIFAPLMFYKTPLSKADARGKWQGRLKPAPGAAGKFVITKEAGETVCRNATPQEVLDLFRRSPDLRLKPLSPIRPNQTGLKIMLRGTAQLNSFPQARDAFVKAAAVWEALISTPITIVIDVDFGPTRFGRPYPPGVLGSTDSQELGAEDIYADVRDQLISLASKPEETTLYTSLPQGRLPTDIGATDIIFTTSALFRALEFLDPVADPDAEEDDFGDPPSIGFNSNVDFDFNPNDGIDVDKLDFDATAVHEIGHALGFTSNAGLSELDSSIPPAPSIWDLFRFRPGSGTNFSTAMRVLSSGGNQVFFAGGGEVPLSTGRPDGSGGDRAQSSHWKARGLAGSYIGIMDPFGSEGDRDVITPNDIAAIDSFGYRVGPPTPDFTLSLTPTTQTVMPGETASFTINVTGTNGFTDAVSLRAAVAPADASVAASFSAAAINPGGTATLTVSTTANTPSSTFTITVTGTSGQLVRASTISLRISRESFTLSLDPTQTAVNPGSAVALTIGAQAAGGFNGTIGLSASVSPSNAGITTALSTASINPGGLVILTVNVASSTPNGNYVITITGRSGQITRTTTGTLAVGGGGSGGAFSLSLNPSQSTVTPGQAAPFTIGVQGTDGFSNPVDLSIGITPSDGTITATLSTTTVTPGGQASLTVNTSQNTPMTTFTITVTGRSGQAARTATAMVTVTAPDFTLGFNSPQVTLTKKQKGQFTVNVNRTGGFAGNVTVTAPDTKALKIKITQPSLSTTGASVSFNFKVKKAAPSGTQQVTFTGRDDSGRVRTAVLTLTIQ